MKSELTAGRSQETEREDGEPQSPVEDLLGQAKVLQPEDVDGLLDTTSHFDVLSPSLSPSLWRASRLTWRDKQEDGRGGREDAWRA